MPYTLVQDPAHSATGLRLVAHEAATFRPSHSASADNEDQVHVRFLASPINRVDLMLLAGRYPLTPKYTQAGQPIPGFDGLGLGTWRREAVVPSSALVKLPPGTPPLGAALLRSGALIAWLLLETVRPLTRGDCVIMSAGTSSVAHFLVQLARPRGVDVVLVVRDRDPDKLAGVRSKLLALGAAAVLAEAELAAAAGGGTNISLLPSSTTKQPVLALDCVYGRVGQLLLDCLAPKGTFSLVGLLAGPEATITVGTEHLFTKQLTFKPFRSSEVLSTMGDAKVDELVGHVTGLLAQGSLEIPDVTVVSWQDDTESGLEKRLLDTVEKAKRDEVGTGKIVWDFGNAMDKRKSALLEQPSIG
ncbi:hypothetical protein PG985_003213 [Apiospora marii]|uniref:uncharacterized protein n=1 Tax=Apiospora marii TaxID=335849 RepID=UPI00312EDE55